MSSGEDWHTLGEELEELERTDPAVREAARRLCETCESILYRSSTGVPRKRFHKSTPDHGCEVEET